MLEGAVMEYAKWFIGLVTLMFIIVLVVFLFRLNEVNSFQQEVNYQVERHGGLTDEAKVELDNHARQAYGGCIVKSSEHNAPCLFPEKSEGGFLKKQVRGTWHFVLVDGTLWVSGVNTDAEKSKAAPNTKSSGFFVKEFRTLTDGNGVVIRDEKGEPKREYIERENADQERYGKKIEYAITRQIGTGALMETMTPSVIGSSASRVRGSAN